EVLDFIGDGVLAIFPIAKGVATPRRACKSALAAAADARARLARLNDDRKTAGEAPIDFGTGLHIGDVVFGNIGVGDRLAFSVIGPAANEVTRLETLTKELNEPILVSGEFAAHVRTELRSLGRHRLRGVGAPLEVLAP
ncbi:MAG: adenylate/guanylate cyclase domain-containing protein, partial [Alphaproteobacteria bacterium]